MLKGFLIISVAYALFAFLQGLYKTGKTALPETAFPEIV
jgi:hypothetical protein